MQSALASLLADCRKEIEGEHPRKLVSHGFRKEGSIFSNAAEHRNRRYVLNIDIENFFPSINFGRVRGFFLRNNNFKLDPKVATILAQIACFEDGLPQGSPSSPIVSDLVGHVIDMRLVKLARKFKCSFSRYADDLTISTNRKEFPSAIAYPFESDTSVWLPGEALLDVIDRAGFSLNHKKTRMQYRGSRQIVTGLTVNCKVNIRSDYYRTARAMCDSLFSKGTFFRKTIIGQPNAAGTLAQLEGILNHIYFGKRWEALRRISSQPDEIERRKKAALRGEEEARPELFSRHGIGLLYERFLFFKKFIALEKPLIICEGKTDSTYLKAAIKKLPAYSAALCDTVDGKQIHKLNFFKYSILTHEILGLGGSSSYFSRFINHYEQMSRNYAVAPLKHPVILLVDNDEGGKPVLKELAKFHVTATIDTTAPFYAITRNLYLVKTPELGGGKFSAIEDCFTAATLATLVGGKKFNRDGKKLDPTKEYSKVVFAERVIAPNTATIDFSGFAPLLDRIAAVVNDYAAKLAAAPP